jgi:osmoprotectant transport system permease protein
MDAFAELWHWLVDPANWQGSDGVPVRVLQHLELSIVPVAIAAAVAIPLGLFVGHKRRFEFLAVSLANVGRAIPSFAVLVLAYLGFLRLFPSLAFGFGPTTVALFLLSVPPILTNTYVGVQAVDVDTVEAARGMGMTEPEVLLGLELPMAMPLIMAGVRTATLTVVATATLSALIGGGGLGRYIIDGVAQGDQPQFLAGAVLVSILAIVSEFALAGLQRVVSPRTSSRGRGRQFEEPASIVAKTA